MTGVQTCALPISFVAIRGVNHDGHRYIESAFHKGIRVFIVSYIPESMKSREDTAFILTHDTVAALQAIAGYARKHFKSTVIAVTGSAGKTVVKEWLAEIAGRSAAVVRSPKSYNSQIGVPLSVLKLDNKFRYGIFEAGISQPGEMENLQRIINPDIGVITNIGDAHSENFRDNRLKATEKLKLFKDVSTIIYPRDQALLKELIEGDENLNSKHLADWSLTDRDAFIYVESKKTGMGTTVLEVHYKGSSACFEIPFTDRASVENAVTVITACLILGIKEPVVREGLAGLVSVAMRMEMKTGINNCHLIEDFYNSDPGSLAMALEFLKSQNSRKTTLILSDFIQSGRNEEDLYGEVASLIRKSGIDRFIGIGQALNRNSSVLDRKSVV